MEWIRYHEKEKVFELRTENSTYQMQVREYDTLVHLYYGSPVGDTLITDRIVGILMKREGTGHFPWILCHRNTQPTETGITGSMAWRLFRQMEVILRI